MSREVGADAPRQGAPIVETVRGPVPAEVLGLTLPHEHVSVDFIGADQTGPHRWDPAEVRRVMLPYLLAARRRGISTFVDCTPAYLGRDVRTLRRLSADSGLHILTNTGLYKEPFLPRYAFEASADELADRWVAEWERGIDGTPVRPGFIKIAVNPGKLVPVQVKVVRAAARASRRTGLVIACHTGPGPAAMEALDLLRSEDADPARFIYVHADAEPDRRHHVAAARAGCWVEFDSVGARPVDEHVGLVGAMLAEGLAHRLLLSHDAGWYNVGTPGGGKVRPYTALLDELMPALERNGMAPGQRQQLLVQNPRAAFAVAAPASRN
ncbi:MAG: phosphotriesterase [Chthonomonadales bacterium]|nr:phosphotriesterase [Chthonomonadales bacterium]